MSDLDVQYKKTQENNLADTNLRVPYVGEIVQLIPRGASNEKPIPAIVMNINPNHRGMIQVTAIHPMSVTMLPGDGWIYHNLDTFLDTRPSLRQSGTWQHIPRGCAFDAVQKKTERKGQKATA